MSDYITIPLTKGCKTKVSIEDSDLANFKWYVVLEGARYYAKRWIRTNNGKRKSIYLHRIIFERIYDEGLCDHEDNDSLNNLRSNLRPATNAENVRNGKKRTNNTSGYKGVYWNKAAKKWQAQITVNTQVIYLGIYDEIELAAKAYADASEKYHSEFGRLE